MTVWCAPCCNSKDRFCHLKLKSAGIVHRDSETKHKFPLVKITSLWESLDLSQCHFHLHKLSSVAEMKPSGKKSGDTFLHVEYKDSLVGKRKIS